jgi:hypothetical protein
MIVIHLPHDAYCVPQGKCACQVLPGRDRKRIASSIMLPAGATSRDLSDVILALPVVQRDVRAGALRVQREPQPAAPARRTERRSSRRTRSSARGEDT